MIPEIVPSWFSSIMAAMQLAMIACWFSRHWAFRFRAAIAVAAVASCLAVTALPYAPLRFLGLAMTGSCHAIAYASLLVWFAMSLRPGREPVVTSLARRVRQTMPDKVVRYTRHATFAWCAFFAAQLAVSAVLLLMAPHTVWSAFVTLLNLPLLVAMMMAEFACRRIIFRHEPHSSLADTFALVRRLRFRASTPP